MSTHVPRPTALAELDDTYSRGPSVMVVTGPVGAGKSTLTRHWLNELEEPHVVVPLVEVDDAHSLSARLGAALGISQTLDVEAMAHALDVAEPLTILLDDFDRLVGSAEEMLERWREAAPHLRWVMTTRRRPALADIAVVEVGPMTHEEATELFELRARQARGSFRLDDSLVPVVSELIDELDRIPLAVELAAGRVHTLGPAEILERLPQRFRILSGRNRTLLGAIQLSWDMLSDAERSTLAQCSVFAGGFTATAAEGVVELDDPLWVVDVLAGLVDQSLLRTSSPDGLVGEVRYDMLTSIREFVTSTVAPCDELVSRHARHYLDCCRDWAHAADQRDGATARARLELDRDNLLAAFERSDDPGVVVDLALTLDKAFRRHGPREIWREVLDRAAEIVAPGSARSALVDRARGEFYLLSGDLAAAARCLTSASETADSANEPVTLAWTRFLQGELLRRSGDADAALKALATATELARKHQLPPLERAALGYMAACQVDTADSAAARASLEAMARLPPADNVRDEAYLLKRVAYAQHYLGNADEHRRLTTEALRLARLSGDRRLEAMCIQGLGDASFVEGEFDDARDHWAEALTLHRSHGSTELEAALLGNLGSLEHRLGRLRAAREAYAAAIELHATTGSKPYEAVVQFGLAVLEFEQGHFEDALVSLERCATLNREIGNAADLGSALLVAAWATEAGGDDASELRDQAHEVFANCEEPHWAALCASPPDVTDGAPRAVVECARALRGEVGVDQTLLHVRAALAWSGEASMTSDGETMTLRVGQGGNWFEGTGERVSLRRRRAPRHIFARLVQLHADSPGEAIDVYEAFDVGWPDEVATADAAADRVYWAVRTLRKLGLENVLMTSGDGYLIDPNVRVVVE